MPEKVLVGASLTKLSVYIYSGFQLARLLADRGIIILTEPFIYQKHCLQSS